MVAVVYGINTAVDPIISPTERTRVRGWSLTLFKSLNWWWKSKHWSKFVDFSNFIAYQKWMDTQKWYLKLKWRYSMVGNDDIYGYLFSNSNRSFSWLLMTKLRLVSSVYLQAIICVAKLYFFSVIISDEFNIIEATIIGYIVWWLKFCF